MLKLEVIGGGRGAVRRLDLVSAGRRFESQVYGLLQLSFLIPVSLDVYSCISGGTNISSWSELTPESTLSLFPSFF